jgi:hypothetical protein
MFIGFYIRRLAVTYSYRDRGSACLTLTFRPVVSKLFDLRATYDFALQVTGQITHIFSFYIFKQITYLNKF